MPNIDLAVAIWNRDTHEKQMESNPTRLKGLQDALAACEMQFGRILGSNHAVKAVFVAPEYYFAADKSGKVLRDGSFNERCVTETVKDQIVAQLLALSKRYPTVMLIPGTIAWSKPIQRGPGDQFKRDPATNQRTATLKTRTRMESLYAGLSANLAGGGSRGGRLPTELLRSKMRDALRQHTGKQVVDSSVVQEAVYAILDDDTAMIDLFGSTDGLFRIVPTHQNVWDSVVAGDAERIMRNTAFVLLNGTIRFKYNKANDFHESLSDGGKLVFSPGHKSGFATIEGIDIGLEICLDHACGQLVNTPLPVSGAPHLHIVTSASVSPSSTVVRTGGCYVHASSNDAWGMVTQRTVGGWQDAELLKELTVAGDPLRIYKITLALP